MLTEHALTEFSVSCVAAFGIMDDLIPVKLYLFPFFQESPGTWIDLAFKTREVKYFSSLCYKDFYFYFYMWMLHKKTA